MVDLGTHSARSACNVGLFVIPKSETVRLNGRKLQRDIDYMMIYEVGTLRLMNIQLDEYDEIDVNENVTDIQALISSNSNDITFFHSKKYKELAKNTKASFCITNENFIFNEHYISIII